MKAELEIVLEAVHRAGERAMELSTKGFETHRKVDDSPVTSADLAVNDILQETIMGYFPNDGWMSEESPDTPERIKKSRVWVIDPIDGTSYFIKGIPQFSISVALVQDHYPILGVVYNPATKELFSAEQGQGLSLNGQEVKIHQSVNSPLTVLVNPSRLSGNQLKSYHEHATLKPMGSIAYSLALVAVGQADGTINFDPLHEWDIAAGWLLVQEGKGTSTDYNGNPLLYNQIDSSVHGILAARKGAQQAFDALINGGTKVINRNLN